MDATDLFSFLAAPEGHEDAGDDVAMEEDTPVEQSEESRKRKAASPSRPSSIPTQGPNVELDNEPGPSAPKRPRMASPKPIVVDEVEIEAKREVAASAGLMGPVEAGARLELRHQVRP